MTSPPLHLQAGFTHLPLPLSIWKQQRSKMSSHFTSVSLDEKIYHYTFIFLQTFKKMFPFMFYYVVTKTDTVTATSLLTRTYTNTLVGLSLVWLERETSHRAYNMGYCQRKADLYPLKPQCMLIRAAEGLSIARHHIRRCWSCGEAQRKQRTIINLLNVARSTSSTTVSRFAAVSWYDHR